MTVYDEVYKDVHEQCMEVKWWQVMERSQEFMQEFSRTPQMKKILNVNQSNPYQKEGQETDKISEKNLLHMFPGVNTFFMGTALHVEDLDKKL